MSTQWGQFCRPDNERVAKNLVRAAQTLTQFLIYFFFRSQNRALDFGYDEDDLSSMHSEVLAAVRKWFEVEQMVDLVIRLRMHRSQLVDGHEQRCIAAAAVTAAAAVVVVVVVVVVVAAADDDVAAAAATDAAVATVAAATAAAAAATDAAAAVVAVVVAIAASTSSTCSCCHQNRRATRNSRAFRPCRVRIEENTSGGASRQHDRGWRQHVRSWLSTHLWRHKRVGPFC